MLSLLQIISAVLQISDIGKIRMTSVSSLLYGEASAVAIVFYIKHTTVLNSSYINPLLFINFGGNKIGLCLNALCYFYWKI